jgi:chromatin remodeling complex protein RSC6
MDTNFLYRMRIFFGFYDTLPEKYKLFCGKDVIREIENENENVRKLLLHKQKRIVELEDENYDLRIQIEDIYTKAREPGGFVIKPSMISDELADFLGRPRGMPVFRTVVTKQINQYIKENGLGDKSVGRRINPDDNLRSLLKLKPEDELTYFNLQRYMSHHFTKNE